MPHGVTGLDWYLSRTLYLSTWISSKLIKCMKENTHVTEHRMFSVE